MDRNQVADVLFITGAIFGISFILLPVGIVMMVTAAFVEDYDKRRQI